MGAQLERIISRGTRDADYRSTGVSNGITCVDGFKLSVIAGGGAYCTPRNSTPYAAVEVGYPSERPEPWEEWSKYSEAEDGSSVYGYVPVAMVRTLIASHGGEA